MPRFLLVVDTPGIKSFVFGTDTLAEIRGGSALLDRLNREETEFILRRELGERADLQRIFAAGGTGQFQITLPDDEAQPPASLQRAMDALALHYRRSSGGELRVTYGYAAWPADRTYKSALVQAFAHQQRARDFASGQACVPQMPMFKECSSASHLPATRAVTWGGERLLLSDACRLKREEARRVQDARSWSGFLDHLREQYGWDWAVQEGELRPADFENIGAKARRPGYIGVVYADGNAMGRLVQDLDSRERAHAFSRIVDESINSACQIALGEAMADCLGRTTFTPPQFLPADILLLGGDDLLIVLPAERALDFSIRACEVFEEETRRRITQADPQIREFFRKHLLEGRGLTISCGVALGRASYPFYLLLDLAEELLKNAKKREYGSYIDFHLVAGSASLKLGPIRRDDYRTDERYRRTARPFSLEELVNLREAVVRLREGSLPQSKLHALWEAAMEPRPHVAERLARETFCRLKEKERKALWRALADFDIEAFPWVCEDQKQPGYYTPLADLIEALELFPATLPDESSLEEMPA